MIRSLILTALLALTFALPAAETASGDAWTRRAEQVAAEHPRFAAHVRREVAQLAPPEGWRPRTWEERTAYCNRYLERSRAYRSAVDQSRASRRGLERSEQEELGLLLEDVLRHCATDLPEPPASAPRPRG